MMVLVDTSVWIRALARQAPFFAGVDELLAERNIAGHELVYGELFVGDHGGRQRFLRDYERLYGAPMVPHKEVIAFVRGRNLHGRGAGWIDVHLLASALVGRMQFWTADRRLASMAEEFGIAYRPAGT